MSVSLTTLTLLLNIKQIMEWSQTPDFDPLWDRSHSLSLPSRANLSKAAAACVRNLPARHGVRGFGAVGLCGFWRSSFATLTHRSVCREFAELCRGSCGGERSAPGRRPLRLLHTNDQVRLHTPPTPPLSARTAHHVILCTRITGGGRCWQGGKRFWGWWNFWPSWYFSSTYFALRFVLG